MAVRRPIFELHIRPMFRVLDRMHMNRLSPPKHIELTDYDDVKARSSDILTLLGSVSPMPPSGVGGPWPQEWIDLFARWTQTGFGRLVKPTGSNFQLVRNAPDRYTLSCDVPLPDNSSVAWFDIRQAQADSQIYEVVMEQAGGAAPAPSMTTIEERIRGPLTVANVIVVDAAGEHTLAIPSV
jgi:hypothetical protein